MVRLFNRLVIKRSPPDLPVTGRRPTVAVDFDGRIAEWRQDKDLSQTQPRRGARQALSAFRQAGILVLVWTGRPDSDNVKAWLERYGIPYDDFNANPDFDRKVRKIYADVYLDDRGEGNPDTPWDELVDLVFARIFGKARQSVDSWEELEELSEEAQPQLETVLAGAFPGARVINLSDDLLLGELETQLLKPGPVVILPPVKEFKRAEEKVESDYDGYWDKLLDVNRAAVAFDEKVSLDAALEQLRNSCPLARPPKDRFAEPLSNGYRDLLLNLRLPCGMICEVQLHLKPMLLAREREKLSYDVVRAIYAALEHEGRADLTPAEAEAVRRARKMAKRIYARAWAECQAGKPEGRLEVAEKVKGLYYSDDFCTVISTKEIGRPINRLKAFCPTGEGGGVDPSCGNDGGGSGDGGKPAEKPSATKPKRAAPGSQLPSGTLAKLKELGADKLPPADVLASEVKVNLDAGDSGALLTWKQKSKSGRVSQQSAYTPGFHARNATEKWERVQRIEPVLKAIEEGLIQRMQDSASSQRDREAAAITSFIRETGLRPTDGAESVKHGHFGISSLQGRHVQVKGEEVHLDFIGKEGVRNRTVLRDPANVAFVKGAMKGTGAKDFLFKEANSSDAIKVLKKVSVTAGGPEDILVKDLRTIKATQTARQVVGSFPGPPPPLSGNAKKDTKLVAKVILQISGDVAKILNNTAQQAKSNYIAPRIWLDWQAKLAHASTG